MAEIPKFIQEEIARYAEEVVKFRKGEVPDEKFRRFRLQHGIYGQRQPNIQMVRIKIPGGFLTSEKLLRLADIVETYAPLKIGHLTTRQDVQIHFVPLERTPEIMTRLAEVGMTTREACSNTVRNVTCCHLTGIGRDELFEIRPYMMATSHHFLRNPVCQSLPRKFKIAFEGCTKDHARPYIHDVGVQALLRRSPDGKVERGFKIVVGGGLSTVPIVAPVLTEWAPEEELIPLLEAVLRIFDRYGERKDRNRARIKFLVKIWGIEKFREEVFKERTLLHVEPSWNAYLKEIDRSTDGEPAPIEPIIPVSTNGFRLFLKTNTIPQRRAGYRAVQVKLIRGDATPEQLRALARLIKLYGKDEIRITIEQNFLIPWVKNGEVEKLYNDLKPHALADAGAETLLDITACPGADTCNLGITSSRGLTLAILDELKKENGRFSEIKDIHIKISGCPNSCGQHHIASIGFHGGALNFDRHIVPSFHLFLGGVTNEKETRYAQPIMKIPSKSIPKATARLVNYYLDSKKEGQPFEEFYRELGKEKVKTLLAEYAAIPTYAENADYYTDWAQTEEFYLRKGMQGECAGAAVSEIQLGLGEAAALLNEAKRFHTEKVYDTVFKKAQKAIASAATALLVSKAVEPLTDEEAIHELDNHFIRTGEFPSQFHDFSYRMKTLSSGPKDEMTSQKILEETEKILKESEKQFAVFAEALEAGTKKEEKTMSESAPAPQFLDLRGVRCPINYVKTKLKLETMKSGEFLQIVIDEGEAYANVPNSVRSDGHTVLEEKKLDKSYQLTIRRK
ncbi:MAG: sulfurtransferase TusA family protein [Candidatus Omnitrophica bacterium]|nr:sulfurtransferase TusA family protein [Candidatus Omnitrophota bacterium]